MATGATVSEGRAQVPLPGPPPPLPRPPGPEDEVPTLLPKETAGRPGRAPAATPGLRVAGFVVERPLGAGAMGQVFLARQTSLDRPVALKLLPADLAADAEFVLRFLREAKAAALLNHPNIIAVIDQGHDRATGCHYIAFELVDGGSVEQLLARSGGRLPEREVLGIARAMLQALAYAEARGVVHRDVKPENILLDRAGTPKLADLGLAKRPLDEGASLTKTGFVLGTPLYMAPEQALGEKDLDVRADLYALGLVLWRCLTGLTPFDEDRTSTSLAILSRHVNQDLPDVRERAPAVSEGAARVIAWLAARERGSRYRTAAQALRDLERLLAGQPPAGPGAAAPAPGAARTSSRRVAPAPASAPVEHRGPPLVVVALVGVAALGLGVGLALGTLGGRSDAPANPVAADPVATATPSETPPVVPPRVPSEAPPGPAAPRGEPPAPRPDRTTPTPPVAPPTPPTPAPTPRPKAPTDAALAGAIGTVFDLLEVDPAQARRRLEALSLAPAPAHPQDRDALRRLEAGVGGLLPALTSPPTSATAHRALVTRAREAVRGALASPPRPDALESPALQAALDGLSEWAHLLAQVALTEAAFRAGSYADKRAAVERVRSSGPGDEVEPLVGVAKSAFVTDHWRSLPPRLRPDLERARAHLAALGRLGEGRLLATTCAELDLLFVGLAAARSEAQAVASAANARRHDLGAVLDPRVRALPTSSTGVELAPARGLYVAPAPGAPPRFTVRVRDVEVTVAGAELLDGRTGRPLGQKLTWPATPGLLLEAREKLLVLTPIDAATGAIGDPVELDLPRLAPSATSAFLLRTETALERVDLVLPGVVELGAAEQRELKDLIAARAEEAARARRERARERGAPR